MTLPEVLDLRAEARRTLPDLSACPKPLFGPAIFTWRARMQNEYSSSAVFEALAAQLARAGFDASVVRECASFAGEERKHGSLCASVVAALGGEATVRLPPLPAFPTHPDAPRRAAALRNLIHVSCLSETVAVALIGAERLEMPEGPLRELLSVIYADEVGHARFGWRLLERVAAELDAEERAAIERYLPTAFAHLRAHELSHLPDCAAPPEGAALGLCSGRAARALFAETVASVIRPGLQRYFQLCFPRLYLSKSTSCYNNRWRSLQGYCIPIFAGLLFKCRFLFGHVLQNSFKRFRRMEYQSANAFSNRDRRFW